MSSLRVPLRLLFVVTLVSLLLSLVYLSAAQQSSTSEIIASGELMLESVSIEERSHVYTFAAHPECVTVLFIRNDTMEIGPSIIVEDISGARPRLVDTLELPAFGQDLYLPPGSERYRLTTNFTMSQEFPLQFYWLQLRLECDSLADAAPANTQRVTLAPNGRSLFNVSSDGQPIRITPRPNTSGGIRVTLILRDPLTSRILNALQLDLSAALTLQLPEGDFLLEMVNNLIEPFNLDVAFDVNAGTDDTVIELNAEGIGFITVGLDGSVDLGGSGVQISGVVSPASGSTATPAAGSAGGTGGINVNITSGSGSSTTPSSGVDANVTTGSGGANVDANVNTGSGGANVDANVNTGSGGVNVDVNIDVPVEVPSVEIPPVNVPIVPTVIPLLPGG